ncbi:MAG: SGNH/GDSL hydrolase family protein [Methylovulum sp.]|nr:SGNH/GDSL hydrolase family protein [Methylovulum sp.]
MYKHRLLVLTALMVAAFSPVAAFALIANVVVAGDSITNRTGLCGATDTHATCNLAGKIPYEHSYASMVSPMSNYDYLVIANAGRGGDTCTTQTKYPNGPFAGSDRGLLTRLQSTVIVQALEHNAKLVSVLIGINDVNIYGVPERDVVGCIQSVWAQLRAAGLEVWAMTYPPISAASTVFANPAQAQIRALSLNQAIRAAVIQYNAHISSGASVKLVDGYLAYPADAVDIYTVDGAHPNAQGARRIAQQWLQAP